MKLTPPRSPASIAAVKIAVGTALAGLLITGLTTHSLWTSHLEEADRQLKAAVLDYLKPNYNTIGTLGYLSGESAPLHLVSLTDPENQSLFSDQSWPADQSAALRTGGSFHTRSVKSKTWRVMGIRQSNWSLRLAMDLNEVVRETTKPAMQGAAFSALAAAFTGLLAYRKLRKDATTLKRLANALSESTGRDSGFPPDSTDSPEIIQLKTALGANLERSQLAVEAAQRFGADAGHELRTPLAIIQGTVGLALQQNPPPEEIPIFLESLLVQCRRLRVTVDALQLLARSDAGSVVLHRELLDLSPIVAELVEDLGIEIDPGTVTITTQLPSTMIQADPGLLRLMIWNLLINAVRHNYPRGGSISVILSQVSLTGVVSLRIENTSPPLAADEHEVIFERFHRGRTARQNGVAGQGLGLSLARAGAMAHGGSLSLLYSDDRGTGLLLVLPEK